MQTTENDKKQLHVSPAALTSQSLQPVSIAQVIENDDDPQHLTPAEADEIFKLAEAEIQPLLRKAAIDRWTGRIQAAFCLYLIIVGVVSTVYSAITYPHTLVVLYAKAQPASLTTTLYLPTRTLTPVTITRSATALTTGTGHQDARSATGTLTFYNGNASQQTIAIGTVITGSDGAQVGTDQTVTIPAANPPYLGQASMIATTLQTGSRENIDAYDINGTVSGSVFVKNLEAFTGGRDKRTYRTVAAQDVTTLTSTVNETLTNTFTTVFPVQPGEAAIPTQCHATTCTNRQIGQEAQSVTLSLVKTCSAAACNSQQLERLATAAFTATRPGKQYRIIGQVQTSIATVFPFTVHLTGTWAFVLTKDDEQRLAEKIAGDTPAQARKILEQTGVIAYTSIPNTLPSESYIDFLVLVGK